MTKQDRWVMFASAALDGLVKMSASDVADVADAMESEFAKRFPPEPGLAEKVHAKVEAEGCIGTIALDANTMAQLAVEHVGPQLEPGQHVKFAMSDSPVFLGIVEDDAPESATEVSDG